MIQKGATNTLVIGVLTIVALIWFYGLGMAQDTICIPCQIKWPRRKFPIVYASCLSSISRLSVSRLRMYIFLKCQKSLMNT